MKPANIKTIMMLAELLIIPVSPGFMPRQIRCRPGTTAPAKKAIIDFVKATTEKGSPKFVAPEARIAVFDQDGTTWVEQPMYTQVVYCLERVPAVVKASRNCKTSSRSRPCSPATGRRWRSSRCRSSIMILAATLTGMTVDEFNGEVKKWLATAKHPRFKQLYTDLIYQPMLEAMKLLRANGYKTYFVTGGGQDFVRMYSEQVYGIPPEQVVGSAGATHFGYDKSGKPILTKVAKLLLNDDNAGKPESIHMMIGRRPVAAFGNSIGDKQMLEYTQAGDGARLMMLVHHDDDKREYAYGRELQDRHVLRRADGRGEEERLVRHQHEERLEAHLRVR